MTQNMYLDSVALLGLPLLAEFPALTRWANELRSSGAPGTARHVVENWH